MTALYALYAEDQHRLEVRRTDTDAPVCVVAIENGEPVVHVVSTPLEARLLAELAALQANRGSTPTVAAPKAEKGVQAVALQAVGPAPWAPFADYDGAVEVPEPVLEAVPGPALPERITLHQALVAKREEWRPRAGAQWHPEYLPRSLPGQELALVQLMRVWIEHSPAKFLTARKGSELLHVSPSAISFHLKRLAAEGTLAYHGRATWSAHPRDHAYVRVQGGVADAEAGTGSPAA